MYIYIYNNDNNNKNNNNNIYVYIYVYIDYIIYIPFATGKVYVLYHISLEVLGGS